MAASKRKRIATFEGKLDLATSPYPLRTASRINRRQ